MATKKYSSRVTVTACSLAIATMSALAVAQTSAPPGITIRDGPVTYADARDATQQVIEAAQIVRRMEQDQGISEMLQQARGIFILPDYGRAALGVGARGGEGVLLVKNDGQWSDPAFYNLGGLSIGVQAGVEAGDMALILNSDRAVQSFMQENNWSLNADAGLTVSTWSPAAKGSVGRGDITAWVDTQGLFGDLALSLTNIDFDEIETAAYYRRQVSLNDIINGRVSDPHSTIIKQALVQAEEQPSSRTSGGGAGQSSATGASSGANLNPTSGAASSVSSAAASATSATSATSASPGSGGAQPGAVVGGAELSPRDREIVRALALANLAEIQSSKLALERARDPQLRQFAERMIDDHAVLHERLAYLAKVKGIQLPNQPRGEHQRMVQQLSNLEGEAFDRAYRQQVAEQAHQETHEMLRQAVVQAEDPQVMALITQALPLIEQHLVSSENLDDGTPPTSGASGASGAGQASGGVASRRPAPGNQVSPVQRPN